MRHLLTVSVILAVLASCSPAEEPAETSPPASTTTTQLTTTTTELSAFAVTSPAFDEGATIPVSHTCDGADVSPELAIVGLPETTQAMAIIVEDPDAPLGTWYHWVEFDIRAESGSFDVARDSGPIGVQGINSWNLEGYMGPCPPEGEEHRYIFRVYALEVPIGLPAGVDADQVIAAMEGHVIDTVELTGTYGR